MFARIRARRRIPAFRSIVVSLALPLSLATPGAASSLDAFLQGFVTTLASGTGGPAIPVATPATPLSRVVEAVYADGQGALVDRGNPRTLSTTLSQPDHARAPEPVAFSNLGVAMLQLLASHEIAHTPVTAEDLSIPVPPGDPVAVASGGTSIMPLTRSATTGAAGPREQTNQITHIFDGSTVYGSDAAKTALLRSNDGTGRLRTGPDDGLPIIGGLPTGGDGRAAENPSLQALHTLFLREHNRLAVKIAAECSAQALVCSGDHIFEGARMLVAATQEKIFYDEILPVFLNSNDLNSLLPDQTLLTQVSGAINEFTAAAGRIGHTMVPGTIRLQDPGGIATDVDLTTCFFNAACLGGADLGTQLFGLSQQAAMPVDTFVNDAFLNAQVPGPGSTILIDLLATNIQRGRDHGLPDFETLREALGFVPKPLTDLLPQAVIDAFPDVLTTGVDALVGLFAELRPAGQYLGDTARALWALQFVSLKAEHSFLDGLYPLESFFEEVSMANLIAANSSLAASDFNGDPFRITPMPLPGGVVLLLTGAAGLLAMRRRL